MQHASDGPINSRICAVVPTAANFPSVIATLSAVDNLKRAHGVGIFTNWATMRQTISNCKFLRSDDGWKNDETRVCPSGWTCRVGIDGKCPSVGRGRYGAADPCSAAGADNDGCALSRIDEWAGAADMPRRLRCPYGSFD